MKDKIIQFLILWLGLVFIVFILSLLIVGAGVIVYGIESLNVICTIVGVLIVTFCIALIDCIFFS